MMTNEESQILARETFIANYLRGYDPMLYQEALDAYANYQEESHG